MIVAVVERRDELRGAGVGEAERLLQRGRQRRPGAEQRAVVGARVGQRELAQRERVAGGLAQAPLAHEQRQVRREQLRRLGAERPDEQLLDAGRARLVAGEQHPRPTACGSDERRVRLRVDRLPIVHEHRSRGGEREQRRGHVDRIGHGVGDRPQRRAGRAWQAGDRASQRAQELVQPGVGEAGLGLHPAGPQGAHAAGAARCAAASTSALTPTPRGPRSVNAFPSSRKRSMRASSIARPISGCTRATYRRAARSITSETSAGRLRGTACEAASSTTSSPAAGARGASRRSRVATTNHAGTGAGAGRARRARRPGSAAASRPSPARRRTAVSSAPSSQEPCCSSPGAALASARCRSRHRGIDARGLPGCG